MGITGEKRAVIRNTENKGYKDKQKKKSAKLY